MNVINWLLIDTNFYREEIEGEDEVDSDFSIDENDEPVSDHGDDEEKRKKRQVGTKAYKVCMNFKNLIRQSPKFLFNFQQILIF